MTVVAAPHPISRRLFADMAALLEGASPPVAVRLATSQEEVQSTTHDILIYLRSECSSACRLAAALGGAQFSAFTPAAVLLTRLEDQYWRGPQISVEAALTDPAYLLAKLGGLLRCRFGPDASELARTQAADRISDADRYCDPFGYMCAVEPSPEPLTNGGSARLGRRGDLLTRTLQGVDGGELMAVAEDAAVVRDRLRSYAIPSMSALPVEAALDDAGGAEPPAVACLVDMAEAPRLPELVQALQLAGTLICGIEPSGEAVARLRSRCVEGGVDLHMTYVVEGAQWKACPLGMFKA